MFNVFGLTKLLKTWDKLCRRPAEHDHEGEPVEQGAGDCGRGPPHRP